MLAPRVKDWNGFRVENRNDNGVFSRSRKKDIFALSLRFTIFSRCFERISAQRIQCFLRYYGGVRSMRRIDRMIFQMKYACSLFADYRRQNPHAPARQGHAVERGDRLVHGRDEFFPDASPDLALGSRRTLIFPVREFIGSTFSWSKLPERSKTAHAVHTPLKNRFRPPG